MRFESPLGTSFRLGRKLPRRSPRFARGGGQSIVERTSTWQATRLRFCDAKATARCRAGALAEADDHGVCTKRLGRACGWRVAGLHQMLIEARLVPAADRPALVEIPMNSPKALAGTVRAWQ